MAVFPTELQRKRSAAQFEGFDLCIEFAEQYERHIGHCFNGAVEDYRTDQTFQLIVIVTTPMYLTLPEQDEVLRRLWEALDPGVRIVRIEPASELFNLWRRKTRSESASPTGGTVEHFLQRELLDRLAALGGAQIVDSESVCVLPFIPAMALHHCVALEKSQTVI